MGTITIVGCRDCQVVRSLDKFSTLKKINTHEEAIEYCKEVEEDSFRAGLLISFIYEHRGHNCTLFYDYNDLDDFGFKEETTKWEKDFFLPYKPEEE